MQGAHPQNVTSRVGAPLPRFHVRDNRSGQGLRFFFDRDFFGISASEPIPRPAPLKAGKNLQRFARS
jgi:hypothetical protein